MARRKITQAADIDPSALPDITPKQLAFVHGILEGKTATAAYRAAYDCSKMQPNSVWANASKLRSHTNVALWIEAAKAASAVQATCTLEGHLNELERLKILAMQAGNYGAAVQAEQLKGKAMGLYVERTEDMTKRAPDGEVLDVIRATLGEEYANAYAEKMGATEH